MPPDAVFMVVVMALGLLAFPSFFIGDPSSLRRHCKVSTNEKPDSSRVSYSNNGRNTGRSIHPREARYGGDGTSGWSSQSLVAAEIKLPRGPKPVPREIILSHNSLRSALGSTFQK